MGRPILEEYFAYKFDYSYVHEYTRVYSFLRVITLILRIGNLILGTLLTFRWTTRGTGIER